MNNVDKYSSRTYVFFDQIYRIVIVNFLTLSLSLFIIPLLSAFTAAILTLQTDTNKILRNYFFNLKKVMKKATLIWMMFLMIFGISIFSIWFYSSLENHFISQIGISFMVVILVLSLFSFLHLPFILANFLDYQLSDYFRASIFISCRYFLYTLYLSVFSLLMLLILPLLPISLLFGISLPLYIEMKLMRPLYEKRFG